MRIGVEATMPRKDGEERTKSEGIEHSENQKRNKNTNPLISETNKNKNTNPLIRGEG
jgi:hypothetical protein